jgi:hypothetical protein
MPVHNTLSLDVDEPSSSFRIARRPSVAMHFGAGRHPILMIKVVLQRTIDYEQPGL